jgi:hypothetical protein
VASSAASPAGTPPDEAPKSGQFPRRFRAICLLAGMLLSAALLLRTQVGGDALSLLARGWRLAAFGDLVPYGNPLSGGGYDPGPATSVVVGLPLLFWNDHRAPVVLIWISHLAAWILLDRRLRRVVGEGERAAFALVFWLNPWRLTGAAVLWNPNYLFLLGAIHFATAFDQREAPRIWSSFFHVLALGLVSQLHPSTLLLIVASVVLVLTRTMRVHWPGAMAGGALALASLQPWLELVRVRPELLEGGTSHLFRALVFVQPWLKGLSYWLRYPSLAVSAESHDFDFRFTLGPAADRVMAPLLDGFVLIAGATTIAIALAANIAFFRARRREGLMRSGPAADGREFLHRYVVSCAAAAVLVFAASPTTPQSWQGYALFHAAAIPVALWVGRRLEESGGKVRRRVEASLIAAAAASAIVTVAIGAGAPNFRCGGRGDLRYPLVADSPMLEELGIQRTCPWPTNVSGAGWPEALPRSR